MIESLINRLEAWVQPVEGTLTAFSGGVDSALVLYLSKHFLGDKGIGVIADSPSLKRSDFQLAKNFCAEFSIQLKEINTNELEKEAYASNPINRCFHCKDTLYSMLVDLQRSYPNYYLLNGTNRDDQGDYRPGLKAASNHHVHAPLADCGLGKADVRMLAKHFDLPLWDKPASPCLSSRIPYGNQVTLEKLQQIEAAEKVLNSHGFIEVRVRHFNTEARIEVPRHAQAKIKLLLAEIELAILELGFAEVTLDEEGLISGKLNRSLSNHG